MSPRNGVEGLLLDALRYQQTLVFGTYHRSALRVLWTRALPRIGLLPEIVRKVSEVPAA